jgi:hypothetical protein
MKKIYITSYFSKERNQSGKVSLPLFIRLTLLFIFLMIAAICSAKASSNITEFNLMDAKTELPVQPLNIGSVVDLATLQHRSVNIQAITHLLQADSVSFELSEQQMTTFNRTDGSSPYSVYGDSNGNYFSWIPEPGVYTLTAITYSKVNGISTAGSPVTITFSFIDTEQNNGVTGFNLINAKTNQVIQKLDSGAVINLAFLPTNRLNIQALTNPGHVGSVGFELNGPQFKNREDQSFPYSVWGDKNGDYYSWMPALGTYTLLARSYSQLNGISNRSPERIISFTLIDDPNVNAKSVPTPGTGSGNSSGLSEIFSAYPNPFCSSSEIKLDLPRDAEVKLEVYSLYAGPGKKVQLFEGFLEAGKHSFTFTPSEVQASGVYLVRFQFNSHQLSTRIIRIQK